MNTRFVPLALAALVTGAIPCWAEEAQPPRDRPTFGVLQAVTPEQARGQAEAWLKKAGKTDPDSRKAFAAIWAADRPVLEKVARTLELGSPDAARILAQARTADADAPTEVPSLLKDKKVDPFLRANLALIYARHLASRRVFDEALGALEGVRAEDVVAPGSYLFCKAVCEHSLMLKDDAGESIDRLLVDVPAAPERYRMVGALMHFDMLTWQDKDLGWVARKMGVIKDRLEIDRGGKKTQKMQKEVVVRLDEMIKQLENQQAGSSQANAGNCPGGGQPGGTPGSNNTPSSPQQDSIGGSSSGKGDVDMKKVKEIAGVWGKLPEKERARAMVELTRGLPPKYRDAIEAYIKGLQNASR